MKSIPFATLCLGCFVTLANAIAVAQPLDVTPREGVVLLTNGEIIRGTIIPAGDRYDVHLDSGEICLRKADVALVCSSVAECYTRKRSDIDLGRVQDHLDLAEWCIRNKLFAEAERELSDARRADATHPKIRLLVARLELARQPAPAETTTSTVRPVSHAPLDAAARNLPSGTMETFTNTIQPLLLNNCSKSGCHSGRTEGGFKLERMHPRFSSRSATQRNLEQVLTLIDNENPPTSALLQTPIHPHGNLRMPIFTDRHQGQYRQLVQWVYAVAGNRTPTETPSFAERTAPLLQAVPGASGMPGARDMPDASTLESELPAPNSAAISEADLPDPNGAVPLGAPSDAESTNPDSFDPTASQNAYTPEQLQAMGLDLNGQPISGRQGAYYRPPATRDDIRVQRGAKLPGGFTPKDAFDPEIFNRRYFGSDSGP